MGCPTRSIVVNSVVTKRSKTAWISFGSEPVIAAPSLAQDQRSEVRGQRPEVRGHRPQATGEITRRAFCTVWVQKTGRVRNFDPGPYLCPRFEPRSLLPF